jgi:hypothetical protein
MIALLLMAVAGLAAEVDFSELPRKAQVAINRQLDGGSVCEIRRERTNGQLVYLVAIRNEGERRRLRIDHEGREQK